MNESNLRILQVSTQDMNGGAIRIGWDLFRTFRMLGHTSWLAVATKKSKDPSVFSIPKEQNRISQVIPSCVQNNRYGGFAYNILELISNPRRLTGQIKGHEYFDYPETWNILNIPPVTPDILHCHNLHPNYFDLRALPTLSHQVSTVLTLHDAWLLSGHCAHSFNCERWKTGCGNCPYLSIYPKIWRDASRYNWQLKAAIFKDSYLHIVTPCQWLMDKVNQSMLQPAIASSRVIPNGIDLRIFNPGDRAEARNKLGLPHDVDIILFAASGIRTNPWKDYMTLNNALKKIAASGKKLLCIALGEKKEDSIILGNVEIRFIPYQIELNKVAQFYRAADIYVHPARADTFPNVILEALACGIPVVASAVGGIPEQILDGRTGKLVQEGDADELAEQIIELLDNPELRLLMGVQAAQNAIERFGMWRMAQDYIAFYTDIQNKKY